MARTGLDAGLEIQFLCRCNTGLKKMFYSEPLLYVTAVSS